MLAGMIMRPRGHFVADQFGREALAAGDIFHLARDLALAGIVDLGPNGILLAAGNPLVAIHAPIIGLWFQFRR